MAVETLDFYVTQADGWVLIATNPASLLVKPSNFQPWFVAITAAGVPAAGLVGVQMGKDSNNRSESFVSGAFTGEAYIRIDVPPDSVIGSQAHFGVIRDQ